MMYGKNEWRSTKNGTLYPWKKRVQNMYVRWQSYKLYSKACQALFSFFDDRITARHAHCTAILLFHWVFLCVFFQETLRPSVCGKMKIDRERTLHTPTHATFSHLGNSSLAIIKRKYAKSSSRSRDRILGPEKGSIERGNVNKMWSALCKCVCTEW